ncbi:hypothetical protein MML48_2g00005915 [Holotrichia oblita]|uniref:Uncharacterized protein n=1 Tax=Holotrichia oblita TaxID=644536 RepID=A0ACB9TQM0_HOLOL|nr:hypothetical protein MML48_2g00005915 [Holotrichia oblita]
MAENIKRSNNFSNSEGCRLLIELVEKNKDIIECKRTDTDNNRKKTDTWKAIENEFNSLSGQTFRDVKVLKNKYENIKKRTKKKVSDNKINIMGTGGGPSQDVGMLGARVEGYPSAFGIDTVGTITFALVVEVDESFLNENVNMEVPSTSVDFARSSNFTASTPNLPQAMGTVNEIGNNVSKKIQFWALLKTKVEETKEECLQQHALQLQLMREDHEKTMAWEEQKHNIELKILHKKLDL